MPTYPYACTVCDHRFEVVQSFTDDALTVCPECSGRLRKVFGSVGVVFKGSGFYRTDSRAASASSVSGSHGHNGSSHADGGATPTDKPATSDGATKGSAGKDGSKAAGSASSGSTPVTTPAASSSAA